MSNPLHWIDSILLIKVILSGAGFRRHQNFRGKNASNQSSRTKGSDVLATHCVVNWDNTLRQSGESEADCAARHCISRPPPGATPSQSERTSTPHADRSTNSTSRGRMGRSTSGAAAGAPAGLTAASVAGAAAAPAIGGAALPLTAATAFWQSAETLEVFFSRHCNAGAPPVGTPAQTFE
jgi:hypothetical protein